MLMYEYCQPKQRRFNDLYLNYSWAKWRYLRFEKVANSSSNGVTFTAKSVVT